MVAKERIEDVVEGLATPIAEQLGYELVDVEYKKEGANWVLRFFIDCPGGVGIDQCQTFSEAIEKVLDAEDPIPGSYLLEVSSPGAERPLKKASDYQRFLGENVAVKLHRTVEGQKKYSGELAGYDEEAKTIQLKTNSGLVTIALKDIAKANLNIDFFGTGGGKGLK